MIRNKVGHGGGKQGKDILLNTLASVISLGSTQLLALPILSRMLTPTDYGTMLIIIGITNALGVALGNPLNNTRLLVDQTYQRAGVIGDFRGLARLCSILSFVAVAFVVGFLFADADWFAVLCIGATGYLVFARAYYTVGFRLKLNFRHILLSAIGGLVGCCIGLFINFYVSFWPAVFLCMELGQFLYIIRTSFVWSERGNKTIFRGATYRKFGALATAGSISALMPYIDRFMIYPMLGPAQVAIYVVASYLGKIVGGVAVPVAGVLLSHDVQSDAARPRDIWKRVGGVAVLCVVIYLLILLVGDNVLQILFPSLAKQADPFVAVATASAIIGTLATLLNPSLLRHAPARFQVLIQLLYLVTLLIIGSILVTTSGLMGFCWALVFANCIRVISMLIILFANL